MATKTLTRGRTDHFAVGVTYLHFPVHVCFSCTLLNCFSSLYFQPKRGFSFCDPELWPIALTYELDLGRVTTDRRAMYLHRRQFGSKIIVLTKHR